MGRPDRLEYEERRPDQRLEECDCLAAGFLGLTPIKETNGPTSLIGVARTWICSMVSGLKGGAMAYVVDNGPEERTAYVIAEVGKVVVMIDELWRDALVAGPSDSEIALGEASQAVHRALIALSALRAAERRKGLPPDL